ncbi:tyrosine-type recombinase/integrase [Vibrio diazotrophicus]|uniref:tyrosine-type recombinase/integrase n=1 Tax=Vibrio diazotrophicus TaxID=685 RepID=UPI000C9E31EB|nr:site-specific integrase [Vibrio diazotrophicus]PNH80072.1 integrase [Vibrio diazotrophicus]
MLLDAEIKSFKSRKSAYYQWDATGERYTGRLGIKVYPSAGKTFVFRYYKDKKPAFIFIGKYPALSLRNARRKATEYSEMLANGLDPIEENERAALITEKLKDAEKINGSIKELFEAHAAKKAKEGKRNYEKDLKLLESSVYPFIKPETKASSIKSKDIVPILAHHINKGSGRLSNIIRSHLHSAFNYGLKHDNDPANFGKEKSKFSLEFNPVSAIPKQSDAEKVGNHFLSMEEINTLLYDMENRYEDLDLSESSRNLIRLCLHSGGQRPYELCNLQWDNIDWEFETLTIPEHIFKTGKAHVVPLTKSAQMILKQQYEHSKEMKSQYIFFKKTNHLEAMPTNTISHAILKYRQRTNIRPFVARDFRRTFKTQCGKLGVSKYIRDKIQGHAMNDVSSKHYDRYDYLNEKRLGLKTWEKALINCLKPI